MVTRCIEAVRPLGWDIHVAQVWDRGLGTFTGKLDLGYEPRIGIANCGRLHHLEFDFIN